MTSGISDVEFCINWKVLPLKVPNVAMLRFNFNPPHYQTPQSCLTSKALSSFVTCLDFSHFSELLREKLNGDLDEQGVPDVDGADVEHSKKDDPDGSIEKG